MALSCRQIVGTHSACFHTLIKSNQTAWQFLTNSPQDNDSSGNAVVFSSSSLLLLHRALPTWCSPLSKSAADTICYIGNSSVRNNQNFNLKKKHILIIRLSCGEHWSLTSTLSSTTDLATDLLKSKNPKMLVYSHTFRHILLDVNGCHFPSSLLQCSPQFESCHGVSVCTRVHATK